jgi:hypothetical protein
LARTHLGNRRIAWWFRELTATGGCRRTASALPPKSPQSQVSPQARFSLICTV